MMEVSLPVPAGRREEKRTLHNIFGGGGVGGGGLSQEMRGEVVQGKRRETRVGTVAQAEVRR